MSNLPLIGGLFKRPSIPTITPPANTPRQVQASQEAATPTQYQTLIATGSAGGLKRRAQGRKRTLIGGEAS